MVFCQNCGNKLVDEANFCASCGNKVSVSSVNKIPEVLGAKTEDQLLLTVKPVYVPSVSIIQVLPFSLFFTVWCGGFFGALTTMLFGPFSFILAGIMGFLVPILFKIIFEKRNLAATEYKFYNTKFEYYEGFLTRRKRTIDYKYVSDIDYRQNIFQRSHGIGTIDLNVGLLAGFDAQRRQMARVNNIKDFENVYEEVRKLISQRKQQIDRY